MGMMAGQRLACPPQCETTTGAWHALLLGPLQDLIWAGQPYGPKRRM